MRESAPDTLCITECASSICKITATTTDGSNLSAVCTINATSGVVTIATDELCDVYSLSGMLVERNIKLSEATSLAPGIYIVRQGAVVKKIAVK